jgi:hypothetical protein
VLVGNGRCSTRQTHDQPLRAQAAYPLWRAEASERSGLSRLNPNTNLMRGKA